MSLSTAQILQKIDNAGWGSQDNVALEIVQNASDPEIKQFDARAINLLTGQLRAYISVITPAEDKAWARLAAQSQFQMRDFTTQKAVTTVQYSRAVAGCGPVNNFVNVQAVHRIYSAERKRMDYGEKSLEPYVVPIINRAKAVIGKTGSAPSIGRGQLTQLAYSDVVKHFPDTWPAYSEAYFAAKELQVGRASPNSLRAPPTYAYKTPTNYSDVYKTVHGTLFASVYSEEPLEDFVVAAYAALMIKAASKPHRTYFDAARVGIAVYGGGRASVVAAQEATSDTATWDELEAQMRALGRGHVPDYVNEIIR